MAVRKREQDRLGGEVAAKASVHVFNRSLLPRRLRITEPDPRRELDFEKASILRSSRSLISTSTIARLQPPDGKHDIPTLLRCDILTLRIHLG